MKNTLSLFSFLFFLLFSGLLWAADLKNLSVEEVEALQKQGDVLIIDVRTPEEWKQTGVIPGSVPLQFFDKDGNALTQTWLTQFDQLRKSPDQPVILVCRSGHRSGLVGNFLTKKLGLEHINHLSTGLKSWLKAGKPVKPVCQASAPC
ncbi:rhodanese-like domain-containing protein [methane-oxidizing endosymbiont of Gigantopelta aegis]|uniref:rhodanese-like domain-containing protein n=1 Tax=methane-oxidizing endosymbiont of Gigantopelta aegis TaxID=2794938 RepID=UPI0018DB0853|nr:rhodanese-like domain-containing protein [methane-oxidizing endosymbiont of Gigantopelta aegis]